MYRPKVSYSQNSFAFSSLLLGLLLAVGQSATVLGLRSSAQILLDATLDTPSQLNPGATIGGQPATSIEGGTRQSDSFLLHSFEQFNVNDGQRVYFADPAGILDILARVTGSDLSNIDGLLGVYGVNDGDGNANLYLINPNGIAFGPNAQLDISGSFVATGGEALTAEDGIFSAVDPENDSPLVTINIPLGIQLGNNPGDITNLAGSTSLMNPGLAVGEDLTLSGGSVTSPGSLRAGSNITLESTIGETSLSSNVEAVDGDISIVGIVTFQDGSLVIGDVIGDEQNNTFNFENGSSVESVEGGGGEDTFNFEGGSVSTVDGDLGNDIFNFNSSNTAANISSGDGDDTFSFNGGTIASGTINGEAGADTVEGTNENDDFIVTGTGQGTVNGFSFAGIEILDGRDRNDTFTLESDGSIAAILGGNDSDTIRFLDGSSNAITDQIEGGTGDLILEGNTIDLADNLNILGEGTLFIQPIDFDRNISIGETTEDTLSITNSLLQGIGPGFNQLIIGQSSSAGAVSVRPVTFRQNTTIQGSDITLAGTDSSLPDRIETTGGDDITLTAGNRIEIRNFVLESTVASGSATEGGQIELTAFNTVELDNALLQTTVESGATGTGGEIAIGADSINLINGTQISTRTDGLGRSGDINITAIGIEEPSSLAIIDSTITGIVNSGGGGGTIRLSGDEILLDAATITTTASGPSRGSSIVLGDDRFSPPDPDEDEDNDPIDRQTQIVLTNNSRIETAAIAGGPIAGQISLGADAIAIESESELAINAQSGTSQNIEIAANQLALNTGYIRSAIGREFEGASGNIVLRVSGNLDLSNESQIIAEGFNGATGGDISIVDVGSIVGGNPEIDGNDDGRSDGNDIIVRGDRGTGGRSGSVLFDRENLSGFIVQRAEPDNRSNDIDIDDILEDFDPDTEIVSIIVDIPTEFAAIPDEIISQCLYDPAASSQVSIAGRGGVPTNPSDPLKPTIPESDWVTLELQAPLEEALAWANGDRDHLIITQSLCHHGWSSSSNQL
ncbi:filamentous hemagglutinin N-terminal domain-containing protein [cf. Phormidesmis sp. LEGE 11477]|uniref:two-partner secretion domain-containing protein n=1 Tax=cf. Phormidesmis sp. LEGE 11477 TaxID=1828680 RepID=UPI0018816590|nr:filamentous hemagglutinin N-terminal domain-containing protein [cf. Phormidesmis sp. LEGE 11477]MBE9062397.1 filamentous hemagglutinin N-terminal domain-containing protein [cf. Phormidesmis sp. LEGE 11477]